MQFALSIGSVKIQFGDYIIIQSVGKTKFCTHMSKSVYGSYRNCTLLSHLFVLDSFFLFQQYFLLTVNLVRGSLYNIVIHSIV